MVLCWGEARRGLPEGGWRLQLVSTAVAMAKMKGPGDREGREKLKWSV